jgi:hypothetical protein
MPSKLRRLRVLVRFTEALEALELPEDEIDVRAVNLTGALYDPRREGRSTFVFDDLQPAAYLLRAKSRHSIALTSRVEVKDEHSETVVTLTLQPSRFIRVRWRTPDGRPITACVTESPTEAGIVQFEVHATRTELQSIRRRADSLDWAGVDYRIEHFANTRNVVESGFEPAQIDGLRVRRDFSRWERTRPGDPNTTEERRRPLDPNVTPDTIGLFELDTFTGVWISAWYQNQRIASRFVGQSENEVVFVTPCPLIPLEPIERERTRRGPNPVLDAPKGDQPRLVFTAVDESRRPLRAVPFELQRLESKSPSGVDEGPDLEPFRSLNTLESVPNLELVNVPRARYVLRCASEHYACDPVIIEPDMLPATGTAGPIEIVLRRAIIVGIAISPAPASRSRIRVFTSAGLFLRETEVDEFGAATTRLAFGAYRAELVEFGRVVFEASFAVDRDPFVLEVRR